ncbi:MAG: cytochrome c [Acidobacteriota bacterium]
MKSPRIASLTIVVLFLGLIGLISAQEKKVLDGKQIFLGQKCNMCHAVSSANIQATTKSEAMKGPDLTGRLASKDATVIADELRKKKNMPNGKPHPKAFTGTDEELGALIAWLQSQKASARK